MACECAEKCNEALERNTPGLTLQAGYSSKAGTWIPMLALDFSGCKRGTKRFGLYATFCPFCGLRYEPETAAA